MERSKWKVFLIGAVLLLSAPVTGFAALESGADVQHGPYTFCGDVTYPLTFYRQQNIPRDHIPGDFATVQLTTRNADAFWGDREAL